MKTHEQTQTSENYLTPDVTRARRNLGTNAFKALDSVSAYIGNEHITKISIDGVTPPFSNDAQADDPRRAYTSESEAFDTGELSAALGDESIDRLERLRLQLISEQAAEKFGDNLVGEALETYDQLKDMIDIPGYDSKYVVTSFNPDEVALNDGDDEDDVTPVGTPKVGGSSMSGDTDYVSRLYIDQESGDVEKVVCFPVPYVHGNGILIGRDKNGSLRDVQDLLSDPAITKGIFRFATDAVRVNHIGSNEQIKARVEAKLLMPTETFFDKEAHKSYMRKIAK